MKRWMILSILSLLLIVSLACGGSNGDTGGGDRSTGGIQINVVNDSPHDICYVYISPSNADSWGLDLLAEDETITTGASKTFDMANDTYDIRLENCSQAAVATDWEVSSNKTVTVGTGMNSSALLVSNQADRDVCYVYISSSTADDWGQDWMGTKESLPSGGQRVFYVTPGSYDMMAADCDQETLAEEYEVDLTSDVTWTLHNQ